MHSPKFNLVKRYYNRKLWSKQMMLNAIGKWVTKEEYEEIVGGVMSG